MLNTKTIGEMFPESESYGVVKQMVKKFYLVLAKLILFIFCRRLKFGIMEISKTQFFVFRKI